MNPAQAVRENAALDRARMMEWLRAGRTVGWVADALGVPVQVVRKVAASERMLIGEDGRARTGADLDAAAGHPPDTPTPRPVPGVEPPVPPRLPYRDLSDHPSARVRRAWQKVADARERLAAELAADEEKNAARRRAAEEAKARREEIARLQARIAELSKAAPHPSRPESSRGRPGDGPDPAVVRAWARANGVDCPAYGRIPKAVRERYEEANH